MTHTNSGIKLLHKKYATSDKVYDLVFIHCQIICDIAMQLIETGNLAVDVTLVREGCMLHDIGVYPLFDKYGRQRQGCSYVTHGMKGEAILKSEGFPEKIWRCASHHTGVGLTKQDIIDQQLPLPVADYLAETQEELLIMYADKFHSKTTPPYFNSFEWYRRDVARFGKDKVLIFERMAQRFGIPDLAPLMLKYGYEIR